MGSISNKLTLSYAQIVKGDSNSSSNPIPIPAPKKKVQSRQSGFDVFSFQNPDHESNNKEMSSKSIDELNRQTSSINLEDTYTDNLSTNSPTSSYYSSYSDNWWNDGKEDSTINSTSTTSSFSEKSTKKKNFSVASYAEIASLKRPAMHKSHSALNLNLKPTRQESWKKNPPLSTSYAPGSNFTDDWSTIAKRYDLNKKSDFNDTASTRSVRSVSSMTSINSNLSCTGSITDSEYHNVVLQIKEDMRVEAETGKTVLPATFNKDQKKIAEETLKYVRKLDKEDTGRKYDMKNKLEWILRLAWLTSPGRYDNALYCPTSQDIDDALAASKV